MRDQSSEMKYSSSHKFIKVMNKVEEKERPTVTWDENHARFYTYFYTKRKLSMYLDYILP